MPRPLFLCVAVLAASATVFAFTGCNLGVGVELAAYDGINATRRDAGLPPLRPDARLVDVARARSADMAAHNYFGHTPSDGCDYTCLMRRNGIAYSNAGETIAWTSGGWDTTASAVIQSWRSSPPHLDKMLNCHYERMGSGVAQAADGRIYVTVVFEGAATC